MDSIYYTSGMDLKTKTAAVTGGCLNGTAK